MGYGQEIVQRVEGQYVGEDCLQIMIPYNKSLNLMSTDGIQFHYAPKDFFINKYTEDERRLQFPYSNIPIHYTNNSQLGKITHVNQLLEFEKPYLLICDGVCREIYAIKNGEEALVADSIVPSDTTVISMTYDELK